MLVRQLTVESSSSKPVHRFLALSLHTLSDNFISASVDMEGELAEAEANVRALDVEFRLNERIQSLSSFCTPSSI